MGGAHGRLDVSVPGDDDDSGSRMTLLDLAQNLDAIDLGHPDVDEDEPRVLRGDHRERGSPVVRLEHTEALVREHPAYAGADLLLVVDDQDRLSHQPALLPEIRR